LPTQRREHLVEDVLGPFGLHETGLRDPDE
jgi:hypothetical protein